MGEKTLREVFEEAERDRLRPVVTALEEVIAALQELSYPVDTVENYRAGYASPPISRSFMERLERAKQSLSEIVV